MGSTPAAVDYVELNTWKWDVACTSRPCAALAAPSSVPQRGLRIHPDPPNITSGDLPWQHQRLSGKCCACRFDATSSRWLPRPQRTPCCRCHRRRLLPACQDLAARIMPSTVGRIRSVFSVQTPQIFAYRHSNNDRDGETEGGRERESDR